MKNLIGAFAAICVTAFAALGPLACAATATPYIIRLPESGVKPATPSVKPVDYSADLSPNVVTQVTAYGSYPWDDSGFADTSAFWVGSPLENNSTSATCTQVSDTSALSGIYQTLWDNTSSHSVQVTIDFATDNYGTLYVDHNAEGTSCDWSGYSTATVSVPPGKNLIEVADVNQGGPGGVIVAGYDQSGNLLFHSDSTWRYK